MQALQTRRKELQEVGTARCREEVEQAAWRLAWAAGDLQDHRLASFAGAAPCLYDPGAHTCLLVGCDCSTMRVRQQWCYDLASPACTRLVLS